MAENLGRLAALIEERRHRLGWTMEVFADKAGVSLRAVHSWTRAENTPTPSKRAALEKALGWAPGSVSELLASGHPEEYTLERLADTPAAPERPRAADLSDDELFEEVLRRMFEWRAAKTAES